LALNDVLTDLSAGAAVIVDLDGVGAESSRDAVDVIANSLREATERGIIIVIAAPDEEVRMVLNRRDIDRIAPVRFGLDDARAITNRMISI